MLPILQRIFACLLKTAIKTLKKKKILFKLFFICHLIALRPTLGKWQGGSFTHLMLITTLFQVPPEGYREPRNEGGSEWVHQWDCSWKTFDSEFNVLSHCVILPKSVLETIDHRLARFFSKCYRSFSLILNTFHTLSQCSYSNHKQVNVGWEVLR